MDIDPPREGTADSLSKQAPRQDLLVLDTNILISHLDYVKKIKAHGLGAVGFPIVLIPWVVLQELDSLKKRRGTSSSAARLAPPAMSYINACLTKREPKLWGQSMQQDVASSSQTATCDTTAAAVRQAKELINVFRERSRLVPGAVSTMENIDNALRPPPPCEAPARDVDMNDTEEEEPRRPPTRRCGPCLRPRGPACLRGALRCSEFWALTTTPRRGRWGGGSSAAAVCLHELRSVVAQLLRAFSRFMYSCIHGGFTKGLKEIVNTCDPGRGAVPLAATELPGASRSRGFSCSAFSLRTR
ncbi:uncharacterized protein LOC130208251 isoform X5 [Pseudoliparis swirei]|uniref:uncharacterized protein LOC130208251 isoform X5 n=1 Tax=Pseudoliparis swirei TaxID=2059687 RepID=UPI0024BEC25E|nr:uncharacterized protein LOC130208251 isoform X5 [Pseudoliparis swirei]